MRKIAQEKIMKEMISFLKDIFMINKEDNLKVGLSQLKSSAKAELKQSVPVAKPGASVKLSDLMRGA